MDERLKKYLRVDLHNETIASLSRQMTAIRRRTDKYKRSKDRSQMKKARASAYLQVSDGMYNNKYNDEVYEIELLLLEEVIKARKAIKSSCAFTKNAKKTIDNEHTHKFVPVIFHPVTNQFIHSPVFYTLEGALAYRKRTIAKLKDQS